MYEKLDNPVYHSLNEYHEKFCLNFGDSKFYNLEVAAFGGVFLLLVFLNFLFDDEKDEHWFHWLESKLADLGNIQAISVFISLCALLVMANFVPETSRLVVTMAGIWGIVVYVGVQVIGHLLVVEHRGDFVQLAGHAHFFLQAAFCRRQCPFAKSRVSATGIGPQTLRMVWK